MDTIPTPSMTSIININDALNNHAIVAHTDAKGIIVKVNSKFCEITGYSEKELLGKTHAIVNSSAHSEEFFIDMWKIIGAGRIWQGEICNRKKDGSLYWLYTTITPEWDAWGKLSGYVAIRTDVTSVKYEGVLNEAQQEATLAILQGKSLSEAVHSTLKILTYLDPKLKLSVLQLKKGKYLHHLSAMGIPEPYLKAINGIEIGPSVGSCGTAAHQKTFVGVDDINTHPHWVNFKDLAAESGLGSCWSLPILSGTGRVFGTIAVYSETAQSVNRCVLGLLERAARALAVLFLFSEERNQYLDQNIKLNNIIQASPLCIHEIDLDGKLLSMNSAGLKMMSVSSEDDIKGIYYPDLSCKAQERKNTEELLQKSLQGSSEHFDYEMKVKGESVYYSSSFSPIRNSDGEIYRILGITEDITARQNNYLALEKAKNLAQQADDAKTSFLSNMSHELRTPLNHIIGFSEVLEMTAQDPDLLESVGYIKQGGHDLLDKINSILELVGENDNKGSPHEVINIVDLVNGDFVEYFHSLANRSNRKFTKNIPEQEIYITADGLEIVSAFHKIAENAIRFSFDEDIVGVSIVANEETVTIEIFDTGPGLPDHILSSKLDPFTIGEQITTKVTGGMGLGLPIAKKLCVRNGGHIELESEMAVGTKVSFVFPLVQPMAA
ncbi:MAG: hypothetical protein COB54_09310 [Alphaproteobacteria bacterium]|nr:MAG: hypothetical protein COB54_09310 [Alphaproteobacteria bacterium]